MYFFKKVFHTNFIICLIFTCTLFGVTFSLCASKSEAILSENSNSYIEYIADNFDFFFSDIQNTATVLRSNDYFKEYYTNSNAVSSPYLAVKVQQFLSHTIGGMVKKQYSTAVITPDHKILSNNGSMTFDFYLKTIGLTNTQIDSFIDRTKDSANTATDFFVSDLKTDDSTKKACTIARYESIDNGVGFVLLFTYVINDIIKPSYMYPGNITFYIDSIPYVLVGKDLHIPIAHLYDERNNMHTYIKKSALSDTLGSIQYVYFVPNNIFKSSIIHDILPTTPLLILAFITFLAMMWVMTIVTYNPIKSTLNRVLSYGKSNSNNEFSVIQETLEQMDNETKSLENVVQTQNSIIEKKYFLDLLHGIQNAQLNDFIADYPVLFDSGIYITCMISYNDYDELINKLSSEEFFKIKMSLMNNSKSVFNNEPFFEIFESDYKTYVIIAKISDFNSFTQKLKKLLIEFEAKNNIEVYGVIGNDVKQISDIHMSYISAKKIYEDIMFNPKKSIITTTETIDNNAKNLIYYPSEAEARLISSVTSGNMEAFINSFKQIMDINKNQTYITKESLSILIFLLSATFNHIISILNIDTKKVFSNDFSIYLELKMCDSIDQITSKLIELYTVLINIVTENQSSDNLQLSEYIINYIKENYMYDISLYDLSEKLNVSQNYAGRLFKKTIGANFKDYLNNYRFTKAKEIINENKNIKMKDVASLVGVNNEILIRMFLKFEGILPSEYQKLQFKTE